LAAKSHGRIKRPWLGAPGSGKPHASAAKNECRELREIESGY